MSGWRPFAIHFVTLLGIAVIWEALGFAEVADPRFLPPPSAILRALIGDAISGQLIRDVGWSVGRAVIGFLLGSCCGIFFGLLTSTLRWANYLFGTPLHLLRPIPPIALVPLVVVWFGIGEGSKVLLVAVGVLFPVWLSVHLGVQAVNATHLYIVRSLHATYWTKLWSIWLPGAASHTVAGLRTAVGIAFYCLIAAEMTGALYGLAYRIELAHLAFRVDRILGHMLILGIVSFLADTGAKYGFARLFPWLDDPENH